MLVVSDLKLESEEAAKKYPKEIKKEITLWFVFWSDEMENVSSIKMPGIRITYYSKRAATRNNIYMTDSSSILDSITMS